MYKPEGFITLKEPEHIYTDKYGIRYDSMSKVLESVEKPFDEQGISLAMSRGDKIKQQQLLKEWEKKRVDSSNYGTAIHNGLENYWNAKKVTNPKVKSLAERMSVEFKEYYRIYPEARLHLFDKKIAGTADVFAQRQMKGNVYDIFDYKTNLERGIQFDSIRRKKTPIQHPNQFMLDPLQHLEDCNYNHYALQLSGYAYMAEITYNIRPGKLFIIFIVKLVTGEFDYRMIPVPYMKFEAARLFEHYKSLKPII